MKKVITGVILSIFCLCSFYIESMATYNNGERDLLTLVSVLQDKNILIKEWSLYAREKVESIEKREDLQKYVESVRKKFPNWDWQLISHSDRVKAQAFGPSPKGYQEEIQILGNFTKKGIQTYIIYKANGESFDHNTKQFLWQELNGKIGDIFRGNATIFSCIKGAFSDKIDTNLPDTVNYLLDLFQAKEIESLKETNFISISAYSNLFDKSISTNENKINMQLGIRTQELGTETTFVVGTPIITTEY